MVDYLGHGFTTTPNNTPTVITSSSLIYAQQQPYVVPSVFTGEFQTTNFGDDIIRGNGLYKVRATGTLPYSGSVMFFRVAPPTGNIAIDFSKAVSQPGINFGTEVQYDFQCDIYKTPDFQSWRNTISFSYYSFGGPWGYSITNSGTSSTWIADDLNVLLTTNPPASVVQIMQNINPQGLLTCNHDTVEFETQ